MTCTAMSTHRPCDRPGPAARPDPPPLLRPTAASASARSPWRRCSGDGRSRRHAAPIAGANPLAPRPGHFPARAKSVIYLFMAGGPSQLELFDYKPKLQQYHGQPIPESFIKGQRFAFMDTFTKEPPEAAGDEPQVRPARRVGRVGLGAACRTSPRSSTTSRSSARWRPTSSTTPRPSCSPTPARTQFGRPSMGSWVTYGIGSESHDLPGFVVLQSGPRGPARRRGQLGERLPADDLPGRAVPLRRRADPQPDQPRGHHAAPPAAGRRRDPRPEPRAARRDRRPRDRHADRLLRDGLPDADERPGADRPRRARPPRRSTLYGAEPGKPSFANNCLLARRLVERGVRFVQLYHTDWDHHGGPGQTLEPATSTQVCREIDQPCAALITRPEAARPARRHAGRLGRRVRPHADGRGPRERRPQPPHRRLHDVDGRRRRSSRA